MHHHVHHVMMMTMVVVSVITMMMVVFSEDLGDESCYQHGAETSHLHLHAFLLLLPRAHHHHLHGDSALLVAKVALTVRRWRRRKIASV
ncbi:hypothetical protein CEXT_801781 [Caerostris extrusa]|uniref:Secreted protein n=1 Tax=Caerostris extrusa TaxID=172846 RepID=A0AAV4R3V5_CAEEX|nr:hypothetical protein CEXT_801781 [Caerostris extrusa]